MQHGPDLSDRRRITAQRGHVARMLLQHHAHLEDFCDFIGSQRSNRVAVARPEVDQTFTTETAQRLSYRVTAGAKPQGQVFLSQWLAGTQIAIENHAPELTSGRFDRILVNRGSVV